MVHVIDAICGAGKTSAAINYMNKNKDNRFIYITPFLNEVERIKNECRFRCPVSYNYDPETKKGVAKIIDLKKLLSNGVNIVTTHAMFELFDDEIIDLCRAQNYVLIMDEVHDVVREHRLKDPTDFEMLMNECIRVDDNHVAHWVKADSYAGAFWQTKRLCDLEALLVYDDIAFVWMFPVKVFEAFNESYILTYMFDAQVQKYYYDYYGVEYDYMYIVGEAPHHCTFTAEVQHYEPQYNYREIINIVDDEKLNYIGNRSTDLSVSWYKRNQDNILMKNLKKNMHSFFVNKKVLWQDGEYVRSSGANDLWTTYKAYKDKLSGSGYAKCFLSCTARATNEYRDRTVVAYMINRYFNPVIKNFFVDHDIEVDEDAYALSEMLQFIWRSGVRDGKHVTIYIPSKRMRELLKDWVANT